MCVGLESVAFGRGVLSKSNALAAFPAKITGIAPLITILVLNKFFIEQCVLLFWPAFSEQAFLLFRIFQA